MQREATNVASLLTPLEALDFIYRMETKQPCAIFHRNLPILTNIFHILQVDSGREFFLPLGELELETICKVYNFRLQVNSAVHCMYCTAALHSTVCPAQNCLPRTVLLPCAVLFASKHWKATRPRGLHFVCTGVFSNKLDMHYCTLVQVVHMNVLEWE